MSESLLKRSKVSMFVLIGISMALAVITNFTGLFTLQAVEVDGRELEIWSDELPSLTRVPITSLPIDSLARIVLGRPDVHKIDISLSIPDRVVIKTNRFEPICFAVDPASSRAVALDRTARVIPLTAESTDWERPVVTGARCGKLYTRCRDFRLPVVVSELERLQENHLDLYRLIDEIDCSAGDHLIISVAGLPYRLKVRTEALYDDMIRFAEFVARFNPDLEEIKFLDFRNEAMIVTGSKRG